MTRLLALAVPLLLAACAGPDPTAKQRTDAEAALAKEFAPARFTATTMWTTGSDRGSVVCGDVEARPTGRVLRFIYDRPGGAIMDPGARYLPIGDPSPLMEETLALFDSTWADICLPHAPLGRRFFGWFDGSSNQTRPDTPIGNAFIEDLLSKSRKQ